MKNLNVKIKKLQVHMQGNGGSVSHNKLDILNLELKTTVSKINEKIVFIRQYRPVICKSSLELPGGHVEVNQTPEDAARTELYEETGYISKVPDPSMSPTVKSSASNLIKRGLWSDM